MIDDVPGCAVSEVAPESAEPWAAEPCAAEPWAAPGAARAGAGWAAIPDDDAVEPPAEHPAASRQAPASSALDAAARYSKDDVMPLGRAGGPVRFRHRDHSFATDSSRSGAGALVHGRSASAAAGNTSTDSSDAPIRAAALAGLSRPSAVPRAATTTGNVSVVAWSRPAAAAGAVPSLRWYSSAGPPRTTAIASTSSGTSASDDACARSARTSNCTPVITKNTGTRNPYPIARSLAQYRSWFGRSSPSEMPTTMPAMNAPSSASTPNSCASAVNSISVTKAPRTRSWEVSSSESAKTRAITGLRHSRFSTRASTRAEAPMASTYSTWTSVD